MTIQKWKWMPRELTKEMIDAFSKQPSYDAEGTYVPSLQERYQWMHDAAPAQEDEPVAYRFFDSRWGAYMYHDKPYKDRANQPLYAYPPDDKLRKAVIELLLVWDSRSYEDMDIEMDLLRAALEEE
jgi:hypothetical protein